MADLKVHACGCIDECDCPPPSPPETPAPGHPMAQLVAGELAGFREGVEAAAAFVLSLAEPDPNEAISIFPSIIAERLRALSPVESPGAAKVDVEIIRGAEGLCVAVNGTRIAGEKPWGGGKVVESWEVDAEDVREALPAAAPREVEEVREALRQADRALCEATREFANATALPQLRTTPGGAYIDSVLKVVERLRAASRLSFPSGEAPERGDGEGRS